jgi:hypothetical protein
VIPVIVLHGELSGRFPCVIASPPVKLVVKQPEFDRTTIADDFCIRAACPFRKFDPSGFAA